MQIHITHLCFYKTLKSSEIAENKSIVGITKKNIDIRIQWNEYFGYVV